MSSGGTNRTSVGNATNNQLSTIATGGNEFNTQLQGLLGDATSSPLASSGTDANTGFANLAATGGYSPTQISALKDEGSDAARSSYSTGSDAYNRAVAASGGYGPSGSTTASLARQGSNAASNAAVGTDAAIAQSQVQNQLAGLQGQAGLAGLNQQQVQSLLGTILGNKTATNAATNTTLGIQQQIAAQPGILSDIFNQINQFASSAATAYAGGG